MRAFAAEKNPGCAVTRGRGYCIPMVWWTDDQFTQICTTSQTITQ
jgi:hypothetical protein